MSQLSPERRSELDAAAPSVAAALLLCDRWMVRHAESVRVVDDVTVRRRFFKHFLLPPKGLGAELDGGVVVPVFLLGRRTFVNCNVRDGGRNVRSLLSADEGRHLLARMLGWVAEKVLQTNGLPEDVRRRIEEAVEWRAESAEQALGPLEDAEAEEAMEVLRNSPPFKELIDFACTGYLLFAVADADVERQVISLELEQRLPEPVRREDGALRERWRRWCQLIGWAPRQLKILLGYDHVALPTHIEVEAPDGITFGRRTISTNVGVRRAGTGARRARFRFRRRPRHPADYVAVAVYPGDTALLRGWIAGVGVTAILAGLAVSYWLGGQPASKSATSLLLLIPGAVPLLVVAHGEHPYVTAVVRGLRYAVIVLAGWMVVAAGVVVLVSKKQPTVIASALSGLCLLAAVTTGMLTATYLRSRPSYERDEFVDDALNRIA